MYVQIIYESKAKSPIIERDVQKIKRYSIQNNINNGVTGYLHYDERRFLHVLEGLPKQVAKTMQRISNDPLHGNIKIRLMNRCSDRMFSEWPFGIVQADDFELRRALKNMGYKSLMRANVLDILKVLKRTAGRKYRTMNIKEKHLLNPRIYTCATQQQFLAGEAP